MKPQKSLSINLTTVLSVHIFISLIYEKKLADEVSMRMENGQIPGAPTNQYAILEGRESIDTRPFELYFALQEFSNLRSHLSVTPQPPEKPLGIQNYHLWFESIIQLWIAVSKNKALNRVRSAISMDEICEGEKIVRHSTSAVDTGLFRLLRRRLIISHLITFLCTPYSKLHLPNQRILASVGLAR
jgi:hypothetical protein